MLTAQGLGEIRTSEIYQKQMDIVVKPTFTKIFKPEYVIANKELAITKFEHSFIDTANPLVGNATTVNASPHIVQQKENVLVRILKYSDTQTMQEIRSTGSLRDLVNLNNSLAELYQFVDTLALNASFTANTIDNQATKVVVPSYETITANALAGAIMAEIATLDGIFGGSGYYTIIMSMSKLNTVSPAPDSGMMPVEYIVNSLKVMPNTIDIRYSEVYRETELTANQYPIYIIRADKGNEKYGMYDKPIYQEKDNFEDGIKYWMQATTTEILPQWKDGVSTITRLSSLVDPLKLIEGRKAKAHKMLEDQKKQQDQRNGSGNVSLGDAKKLKAEREKLEEERKKLEKEQAKLEEVRQALKQAQEEEAKQEAFKNSQEKNKA